MTAVSALPNQLLAADAALADVIGIDDVSAGLTKGMLAQDVADLPEYLGTRYTEAGAGIKYRESARYTSGTPVAGIGYGWRVTLQTAASNVEFAGAWRIQATDVTDTSEDFKWVGSLMVAGAAPTDIAELTKDGFNAPGSGGYYQAGTKVLGARVTGFVTSAGTAVKDASTINADTITATDANLQKVAKVLKALLDAGLAHGLVGA